MTETGETHSLGRNVRSSPLSRGKVPSMKHSHRGKWLKSTAKRSGAYPRQGCWKFLLLFGRIGPLEGFLPHSVNILQIPWWYGDMDWYGMYCARPCALLRGPVFLMPLYHALKILSPPEDVMERTGFSINPHVLILAHAQIFCICILISFLSVPRWRHAGHENENAALHTLKFQHRIALSYRPKMGSL